MLDLGLPDRGASIQNREILFARCKKQYRLVGMDTAIRMLKDVLEVALDFETTALSPDDGRIRITSLACDDWCIIIDHDISGSFAQLYPHLRGKRLWVYNAKFETKWCDSFVDDPAEWLDICDIDFLAKSKLGGHPTSLVIMCKRDLKIYMDKEQQRSDWSSKHLLQEQMDYAAFDSYVTWKLFRHWEAQLTPEQFRAAIFVFNASVRGTIECEDIGLELDIEHHEQLVALWEIKRDTFERYLRKYTPESVIKNLRSDKQIGDYLTNILDKKTLAAWPRTDKKQQMQFEGKYLRSVSRHFSYPFSRWLAALAGYKYYNKYLSTYGENMINSALLSGKVKSRFNIAQAATGRYSASSHNLQNIPRKVVVRKSFCTLDRGRVMCLADYKGIEIRTLAELTDDATLRHDAVYGDVHAASCAQIFEHDLDYVLEVLASGGEGRFGNVYPMLKEQRSKAKGFTFQLLYGAGPGALSDVLKCSFDEAVEAVAKWAARYPDAYNYRNVMFQQMVENDGYLPVWDGRTIRVFKQDQSLPVAANYGVQGAAASVMYRCVHNVHRNFVDRDLPAWCAATVHDEMLSYTKREFADDAMEAQIDGMTQAWLDIFPGTDTANLVDWAIGETWAAKP